MTDKKRKWLLILFVLISVICLRLSSIVVRDVSIRESSLGISR